MKALLFKLIEPRAKDEDDRRQEFILNILLVSAGLLLTVSIISSTATLFFFSNTESRANNALSFGLLFSLLGLLLFLYLASRRGFFSFASHLLLGIFFLLVIYMNYRWGVDLPSTILLDALVIVMSGILINTRFAFITTAIIAMIITTVDILQKSQITEVDRYWRDEPWLITDTIVTSVIFLIIAIVSWLSNREIEKSLARARKSEAELKIERDSLEVKIEERTKELKETQAEKMTQLYRFAEFGRLSAGLFHDLINPLNAVSLNVEKLRNQSVSGAPATALSMKASEQAGSCVDRAVRAAKRLEDMVVSIRKQLTRQENKITFSLKEEIEGVINVLSHKAQNVGVTIRFLTDEDIHLFGDAMKFNQVALNLIVNAIDAYLPAVALVKAGASPKIPTLIKREIIVSLQEKKGTVIFSVNDRGMGISDENKQKIFEPFFTTKAESGGIGIGLSMTKRIVEKDFGGSIEVRSEKNEGSEFLVSVPIVQPVESAEILENNQTGIMQNIL